MTLTDLRPGQTMPGMVRCSRAFASLLVVFGVLTSTWATCTAGAMMLENAQMACCKAGHHECGPKGTPADCCKKTEAQQQQWTATKTELVKAPNLVVMTVIPSIQAALPLTLLRSPRCADFSPSPHPLGPPAYIVNSALLI